MAGPPIPWPTTRAPEDITKFRTLLTDLIETLARFPEDVRTAYIDELQVRVELKERLLPREMVVLFTLQGVAWGEECIRKYVERVGDAGPSPG
jgi:hypothetical protein